VEGNHRILRRDQVSQSIGLQIENKGNLMTSNTDVASERKDFETVRMRLPRDIAAHRAIALEFKNFFINIQSVSRLEDLARRVAKAVGQVENIGLENFVEVLEPVPRQVPLTTILTNNVKKSNLR
jgi:hypothetical protein